LIAKSPKLKSKTLNRRGHEGTQRQILTIRRGGHRRPEPSRKRELQSPADECRRK